MLDWTVLTEKFTEPECNGFSLCALMLLLCGIGYIHKFMLQPQLRGDMASGGGGSIAFGGVMPAG